MKGAARVAPGEDDALMASLPECSPFACAQRSIISTSQFGFRFFSSRCNSNDGLKNPHGKLLQRIAAARASNDGAPRPCVAAMCTDARLHHRDGRMLGSFQSTFTLCN
jgi:hypothetical protein